MQPCCKQFACDGEIANRKYVSAKYPGKTFRICSACRQAIRKKEVLKVPKEFTCIVCRERMPVNKTNFHFQVGTQKFNFLVGCKHCNKDMRKQKNKGHHPTCNAPHGYACSCPEGYRNG